MALIHHLDSAVRATSPAALQRGDELPVPSGVSQTSVFMHVLLWMLLVFALSADSTLVVLTHHAVRCQQRAGVRTNYHMFQLFRGP